MTRLRNAGSALNVTMPPPEIDGLLPDVGGGDTNLLPEALTHTDLKVWFTVAINSDPTEGKETVELFDGDDPIPVASRDFHQPITDADRYVLLPRQWLRSNDGEHRLYYRFTIFNTEHEDSSDLVMTLDTRAPVLASDSKLIFPCAVLPPNALTADYLAEPGHQDQVQTTVPAYLTAAPGDVVIVTWKNPNDGTSAEIRTDPLTHLNYTDPITLIFTGEFIRAMGDGQREVSYWVEDRAKNRSVESSPVELLVAAIRPPRFAPHPMVVETGESENWAELDPEKTLQGATVHIPEKAVYFQDDEVAVQFGMPGSEGAIRVPVEWGTRDVAIPKETVAAFFGKTLQVTYEITLPDGSSKPSDALTLVVQAFPPSKLLGAQIAAPHSDPVYKSQITPAGLPIHQRKWPYISTYCLITITVTGTGMDDQSKSVKLLDAQPVSEQQTIDGVSTQVSQTFMLNLKSGSRFIVLTQVSFDNGANWFPFTEVRPTLRDGAL